jgi:uncharacterized protein YbdZ (MbtH family)
MKTGLRKLMCMGMEYRVRGAVVAACILLAVAGCGRGAPPDGLADAASPPELVRLVHGMMPRIERLSGLDRVGVLRLRLQSRAAARQYVEQRLDTELPPERLEGIRRTYVALGLLPDTLDLRALLLDLYTEQVLGYYDPRTGTLYVVEGEDLVALRPVLAHELVHALQDQHTNIDSLVAQARGNDRQTAAHAALEGHAMLVMFALLAEEASRREIDPASLPNPADELGPALAAQNEEFPVFRRAPPVIRETLLFPYVRGADFVHQLWRSMSPSERYPAPIDTLLPQSTAQVMRPLERFIQQRTDPVEIRLDSPPAGWRVLHEDTFGQLETAIFLGEHLGEAARASAHGWAGDRYMLVTDPAGAEVLHWLSAWESEAEANRFAATVRQAAERRTTRRVTVTREDLDGMAVVRITDAAVAAAAAPAWQPAYHPGHMSAR